MKQYIKNSNTKQIHRVNHLTKHCNVNTTKPGQRKCGAFAAWFLLTFRGWDGCGHCWPEKSKKNS